ncbi:glyoxalase/bleomycin resistance/extradiol dioxygenase family protein [Martelella alba]|uniref:Glyoxalase/bleomycin resistance/extradiol dioxygenase family protein n=1 Tax=Martelella alba TaxID=2590451 RepID=A0A506U4U2_9HYPH|nr:VOC family protein [Martelella alba]TPW28084.1 glyoxalase/bleomycin resistance/extradiol dioxygenase family protein [Martelella alba]
MIAGILESALYVDDLDAAEAFYGGILGLTKIARQENRHIFFRVGPGVLLLFNPEETVLPAPDGALPVPAHGAKGQGHLCFHLEGNDFAALLEKLADHDIPVEADFRWPNGARSVYFRDPAGNSLECAEKRLWNL